MAEHLLTVRELANAWNTSEWFIYERIRRGELRAVKVGRGRRIRPADARAYLERTEAEYSQEPA